MRVSSLEVPAELIIEDRGRFLVPFHTFENMCSRQDSNPRPNAFRATVLPTTLREQLIPLHHTSKSQQDLRSGCVRGRAAGVSKTCSCSRSVVGSTVARKAFRRGLESRREHMFSSVLIFLCSFACGHLLRYDCHLGCDN